jgi:DNA-binding MarR family transcriptional regulator
MARTVHGIDQSHNAAPPPLLGALLRRPFMAMRAHIVDRLREAGFDDLQPAHLAVFQHPGPHGRSPGDIARGAQSSKQAVNNLLGQLERLGYLRRGTNPGNRRERIVALTAKGEEATGAIRAAVTELAQRWRAELGDADYELLCTLLQRLNLALEE